MMIVMEEGASEAQIQAVIDRLVDLDFTVHRSTGVVHTVLGCVGPADRVDPASFEVMEGVFQCRRIMSPYKLASRAFKPGGTVIEVRDVRIGDGNLVIFAGPSVVENRDQIFRCAELVAEAGGSVLRGGVFPPWPAPYGFPGLGEEGLRLMREAADANKLAVMAEVTDLTQIALVASYADILLVGSRNMQSIVILDELRKLARPVLLERGIAATIDELLLSADYLLAGSNYNVMLCERGIRTFEGPGRNVIDITAAPIIKKLSHLPILMNPSSAAGRRDYVLPLARAAAAVGADGLLIEVHPDPDHAAGDSGVALRPDQFTELTKQLLEIGPAKNRRV